MDTQSIWAILSLAFGLGLLHALDADHIMAVSSLATSKPTFGRALAFCLRWALGHGSALLVIGGSALIMGITLPPSWNVIAEQFVGLLLIGLGCWVLINIRQRGMILTRHQHPGLPHHVHWQTSSHNHQNESSAKFSHFKTEHSAVLVGVLHGIAGSAPLLILIPVVQSQSTLFGFAYLFIFSGGVFCSMLIFGGLLGSCYQHILGWSHKIFALLRITMGAGAIGYGSYIIISLRASI